MRIRSTLICVAVLVALVASIVLAENLVSRPVGFVRIPVRSNTPALVSSPFDALSPAADTVLVWDAASQEYVSTSPPPPGAGFWIESEQDQSRYFLGEVVLDGTNTITLLPGFNLVGYPYSSAAALEDTGLSGSEIVDQTGTNTVPNLQLGEGYWLNVTGAESRVWVEVRPYDNIFPPEFSGGPSINEIRVKDETNIVLMISPAGSTLDVLYQDACPTGSFQSSRGWAIAEPDLVVDGTDEIEWQAPAIPSEPYGRYYLVGRSGLDMDGNGIPDLRDIFVNGRSPAEFAAYYESFEGFPGSESADLGSSQAGEGSMAAILEPVTGTGTAARIISGKVIYVDKRTGHDDYSGRSLVAVGEDGPKETIAAGLEACERGGMLVVRPGVYPEGLNAAGRGVTVRLVGRVDLTGRKKAPTRPVVIEPGGSVTNL